MRDGIDDYIRRHVETEAAFTGEVLDQLERRLRALEAQISENERKRLGPYLRRKFVKLWASVAKRVRGRFPQERAFFRKVKRDLPPGGAPVRDNGRLFVDVTQTVRVKFMAGIPRVVLESVKVALARGGAPVFLYRGEMWTFELPSLKLRRVRPRRGDALLLLDQSWTRQSDVRRVLAEMRAAGGSSVAMIHDLLPAQYPECFPPSFKTQFADWLALIAGNVDTVITISRDVAEAFAQWATVEGRDINPALKLAWNHLGADFDARGLKPSRRTVKFVGASSAPYFLSVSTLESRKGYGVALEAMELLWRDGVDARYVIVGKYGWGAQALAHRLRIHPENGKRLAWFEGLGDGDLDYLMKHACGLVFPTVAEGFGLPIVEAARYGLPVIASDISVFREIAGDGIAYFAPGDGLGLARRMRETLAAPTPAKIKPISWRQSADAFIDIVEQDAYPVRGLAELQAFAGGTVEPAPWTEPATGRPPAVSIVTVTRDSLFYTRLQVEKIREGAAGRDCEIIVVDRGSRDGTLEWLSAQPDVRVIDYPQTRTAGHGHGEAAEIGVRAARHARIALLDSDAFPVGPQWLEATVDRLDEEHRLAGAAFVADRAWHDHGWYVHPHFMAFFKADLGGLIVLRKLRGDAEDTGEESTIRVLAAGKRIVRHPIEFYAPLGVGRQDIPTISAGVVHAWYSSRLALQEPEVKRESAGAISVVSYGAPLQEKIRAQFGLSY